MICRQRDYCSGNYCVCCHDECCQTGNQGMLLQPVLLKLRFNIRATQTVIPVFPSGSLPPGSCSNVKNPNSACNVVTIPVTRHRYGKKGCDYWIGESRVLGDVAGFPPMITRRQVSGYFDNASTTLSITCSLRFFMPNQTMIAIDAPRPIPIPQKIGVMIV